MIPYGKTGTERYKEKGWHKYMDKSNTDHIKMYKLSSGA